MPRLECVEALVPATDDSLLLTRSLSIAGIRLVMIIASSPSSLVSLLLMSSLICSLRQMDLHRLVTASTRALYGNAVSCICPNLPAANSAPRPALYSFNPFSTRADYCDNTIAKSRRRSFSWLVFWVTCVLTPL